MRRMRAYSTLALLGAGCVFLSGCAQLFWVLGLPFGNRMPFNPAEEPTDINIQRNVQFADVPVPMNFALRWPESQSYRSVNLRTGDFLYEGAWTYRRTAAFYERQMPLAGWTKAAEEDDIGWLRTVWSKGPERCSVFIDDRGQLIQVRARVYRPEGPGRELLARR